MTRQAETFPRRPMGVTMVAFVLMALAVANLVGGVAILAGHVDVGPLIPVAGAIFPLMDGFPPFMMIQFFLFLKLLLVLTVAYVVLGAALLRRKEWARVGTVVLAGFGVLAGAGQVALGSGDGFLGVLAWGGLIVYFLRPEVKEWFRAAAD